MQKRILSLILSLCLVFAAPGAAFAFGSQSDSQSTFGNSSQPSTTFDNSSQPSTTFDSQSGNQYRTQPNSQGGTTTHGSNPSTGSTWSNSTDSQGNQSGVDSDGNRWEYDNSTGTYRNYGTGEIRQHNR